MENYWKNICTLSNRQLGEKLQALATQERRSSVAMICHLVVAKQRRLALELGYKSLFDYCQKHLMMDPGIIYSRLQIANKAVAYPILLAYLAEGKVSLTVAAKACTFLDGKIAANELLDQLSGKTVAEALEVLRKIDPEKALPHPRKAKIEEAKPAVHLAASPAPSATLRTMLLAARSA